MKSFLSLLKHYISILHSALFFLLGIFVSTTSQLLMFITAFLILFLDFVLYFINSKGDFKK